MRVRAQSVQCASKPSFPRLARAGLVRTEDSLSSPCYPRRLSASPAPGSETTFEGLLIGGERREGTAGEQRLLVNPANGEPLARVAQAAVEDVDRAARLAEESYRSDWRRRMPRERAAILFRVAALIPEHGDELAAIESRNVGTPLGAAKS